jgi:resuscitation-promoting factor RpfB
LAVRPTRVRRLRIHRALQATTVAVACLTVAGVSYLGTFKFVTLVVSGRPPEAISTTSQNVRELLQGEGIMLSSSVRVLPPPTTELADGMTVVVSPAPGTPAFGAPAPIVGAAVDQGSTGVGVWVVEGTSSGPAARIAAELAEASASAVGVGTSPVVSVRAVVAGKVHDVLTNASTTGELLSAMGITPDASDRVQPPPSTPLHAGSQIRFDRVEIATRQVRRSIPVDTRTHWTTSLGIGQTRLVRYPVAGLMTATLRFVVVNGKVESREVVSSTVLRPASDGLRISGPASPEIPRSASPSGEATGQATWYDPPWSGLSAASPWIPFGTRVAVTDLASGRTVIVVINDRGPFSPGRIIDLSPEAFSALAQLGRGVLDVRISW